MCMLLFDIDKSFDRVSSPIFKILASVPQGSALYTIFTYDINTTASEKALFADKTCLYTSNHRIQKRLNTSSNHFSD